jgi:pimeloyl-ACP methyl ester carboxylesterase
MVKAFLFLTAAGLATASVDIPERMRGGKAWKSHKVLKATGGADPDCTPHSWDATVDHFDDSNKDTYKQRYYVDDQYYSEGGPVFFEIGGEGTLSCSPGGYMAVLAEQYNAKLVALEHRFYGDSIPNDSSETDNLKFLTVENALADLNGFTEYYRESANATSKWFVFGGSYPGGLASWYRIAYPDASVGSLSSSGVVNPIIDFYQFDTAVSAAIGNQCADRVRRTQTAFENEIKANGLSQSLDQLNCESDTSTRDFFYMIADSWSMADQYSALCL